MDYSDPQDDMIVDFSMDFMFTDDESSFTGLSSPLKEIKLSSGLSFLTTFENLANIKRQLHDFIEKDLFLECDIASCSSDTYRVSFAKDCILCLSNADVNELIWQCDNEKDEVTLNESSDEDESKSVSPKVQTDDKPDSDSRPTSTDKSEATSSKAEDPDKAENNNENTAQKRKSSEKSGSETDTSAKPKKKIKKRNPNKDNPKSKPDDEDPDSSDEEINKINRAARRIPTYKSIKNLTKFKYYKILDCITTTTSQGKTIRLKLQDESVPEDKFCYVHMPKNLLPELFAVFDALVTKIQSEQGLYFQFRGMKGLAFHDPRTTREKRLAKERQSKKRKTDSKSKQEQDREKARLRMRNLRQRRRLLNKSANKKFAAERKKILRDLKKCSCNFEETSTIDILQHNFICYEKSLQWHECVDCHKKLLLSNHTRITCRGRCEFFSSKNNMDPLPVPNELLGLTYIEKQLICRVHSVFSLYKVQKGQYKYKGQVINFPQEIQSVADTLPHLVADLNNLVIVKLSDEINLKDFYVRKSKVLNALIWLKDHNPLYSDITIDEIKIASLPDNGNVLDDIQYIKETEDKEVPDHSVDNSDEDNDSEFVTSSGVPDFKDPSLNATLNNTLIWPSIGSSPINEFGTPGYITLCFPHLFPYGEADYSIPRPVKISLPAYIQHLMTYKDERFAKDERFRYFMMNSQMRWNALNLGNLYVKKNAFFTKMTISQLKEYLKNNKHMVKQIMYYGSRIRSTKSYWNSRCGELLDMVQQIGDPTVFFTLSAADFHWPNLFRLLGKDVNHLSVKDRADLIASNPLVADSYFYMRSKFFIDHCFKPHFGVTDIWYRYEFQHRGSVHLHGLAWFKDAPKLKKTLSNEDKSIMLQFFDSLISCENPDLSLLPSITHPCQITLEQVTNVKEDLAQLCNHVQRHTKCRVGFCLKQHKNRGQYTCKYNFPKPLVESSSFEYKDDQISDIQFKRNDPFLNKYNPWVLQTWRANIDFSPIFSKMIVYRYIAKYASKSEIKSNTYNEIMTNILDKKCAESENCKQAVRKLLLTTCSERDYCAQEVFHFLMGYHFFEKSREIVIINLNQRDWVSIQSGFGSNNIIDSYTDRPPSFQKLSIFEYNKFFSVRNGIIQKRKTPAVVRYFPRCLKEYNEDQYYLVMSQIFFPWSSIDDVAYVDQEMKEYVNKCIMHYIDVTDHEIEHPIDMNDNNNPNIPPDKDNEQILSEFRHSSQFVNLGKDKSDLNHSWDKHGNKLDVETVQCIDKFLRKDINTCGKSPMSADNLNLDQMKFFHFIQTKCNDIQSNDDNSQPIFCFLQGMPGTGKSYVLKTCVSYIADVLGSECVKVVAPTGVAAKNVDGSTIHSFLLLGKYGFNMRTLTGPDLVTYRERYHKLKFLFLEECSMIGLRMLACLEKRCREITDCPLLFGGVNVILCGDVNQLLPIGDQPLYADVAILTQNNNLLERGKLIIDELKSGFILKKCHRFSSEQYVNFLKRIASGRCSTEDVNMINKRCLGYLNKSATSSFNHSLRICTTNDTANEYNLQQLEKLKSPTAIIKADNNNRAAFSSSDDFADGLLNDLYLAEGAKVMLKKNINVSRGLVNGCVGVLKYFIYKKGTRPPSLPVCILIAFENVNLSDLKINLVPILPTLAMWYKNGISCTRFQLPVILCWACTVHRSQGLTLASMILDVGNSEFALGLLYVALSRVSDKENLCLVLGLTLERLNSVTRSVKFKIRKRFLSKLKILSRHFPNI